ncbi:MmpS family transport accessory protein [Mycobacterium sp. CVI_P3]|uniref:MmpS family transport accessory protein n=1 Tax=Mycobacterium pinniadriaticum TaxID=2994102 RepID=A0ABT3SHX9_9MYCO|nr:MmpS family transport accessory protein [Mycobacterium pinniadriaticum]MCX2932043.1 MmpS family transport accessory protein [Mycobacterium pinniadriaticum]MCX2938467.1 MmpS family transport accessory protein [Mycobacterium pinniadriaticum]
MKVLAAAGRAWIPLVLVVVLAVGAFAVSRVRGIFGSHQLPTYAGSMSDDKRKSDPKRVVYQIFGPPGTIADINYLDDSGTPHQVDAAVLPWSVEIVTTAPAMAGNVLAQGNSDSIGCRITADGEVKMERTTNEVSAYVYCFVKSA